MNWKRIVPINTGGSGRSRKEPAAILYQSGQLVLNHAAADKLGNPSQILVDIEPEAERIRLAPTTPDDTGGFSLSGGGNTQRRITAKQIVRDYPQMIGKYGVRKIKSGIELYKESGA